MEAVIYLSKFHWHYIMQLAMKTGASRKNYTSSSICVNIDTCPEQHIKTKYQNNISPRTLYTLRRGRLRKRVHLSRGEARPESFCVITELYIQSIQVCSSICINVDTWPEQHVTRSSQSDRNGTVHKVVEMTQFTKLTYKRPKADSSPWRISRVPGPHRTDRKTSEGYTKDTSTRPWLYEFDGNCRKQRAASPDYVNPTAVVESSE